MSLLITTGVAGSVPSGIIIASQSSANVNGLKEKLIQKSALLTLSMSFRVILARMFLYVVSRVLGTLKRALRISRGVSCSTRVSN